MDKNTVTGLLLIAALMFGFMMCNNREKEKQAQQAVQTEQKQAAADKAQDTEILQIDSAFAASVNKAVLAYGTRENGRTAVSTDAISLSADSAGNLTGTIATTSAGAVSVNAVLDNNDKSITPQVRTQAAAILKAELQSLHKYRSFANFLGGASRTIRINNKKIDVTFSSKGGMIQKVVLPGYKTETTETPTDICLFDAKTGSYEFEIETADQRISTAALNFRAEQLNDTTVLMSLPLNDGAVFSVKYTVVPDDYIVRMDIIQSDMQKVIPTNRSTMRLKWNQTMMRNEVGRTFEERNSAIYYKFDNESPDDLDANADDDESLSGNIKWIAFKNQFFSSVLVAKSHFDTADLNSVSLKKDPKALKKLSADATFAYSSANSTPASFAFFFGPNSYPLLSDLDDTMLAYSTDGEDLEFNKLVPLGWGIFGWINRFIVIPVFHFLNGFISNYGIIILILTILLKIVLFPLSYKSFKSQAKMRVLAPEIKEINDKYPGQENAMKRQQETMSLYSKAGASPFSGCLPMLLQMPFLIAMFWFFPSAIELRGQSFLWAHDLSAPDYLFTLPFSIPFLGNHLSLFCLLMTVVNIIYTRINMQNQPSSSAMPGMKWMMYLMPLMFLFFFNDYASALSYYYFVSLLITIMQTYAFRWFIDEKKVRAQMLENAKKPRKKSGLMARLEAAQKRQEQMMREQQKRRR